MNCKNKKITVVCGGISTEREVSLRSGEAVYNALKEAGYPSVDLFDLRADNIAGLIAQKPDLAFLALHGYGGEDGCIQGALELAGIKYTGSGYLGAALAMDKDIAKKLARAEGILTADWITLSPGNGCAEEILSKVGLPCVIKPCGCGSSVGVTVVRDRDSLNAALKYAEKYENRIIAEKLVEGRELTCGVLNGQPLPPVAPPLQP